MNLQNPKKFKMLIDQAHESALNVLRPISRKYDKAEHSYPKELDMFASLIAEIACLNNGRMMTVQERRTMYRGTKHESTSFLNLYYYKTTSSNKRNCG